MDERRQMALEVASLRAAHVERVISNRIARFEGNATNEQIEQWERDAYRWWIDTYPTLNSLLIPNVYDPADDQAVSR